MNPSFKKIKPLYQFTHVRKSKSFSAFCLTNDNKFAFTAYPYEFQIEMWSLEKKKLFLSFPKAHKCTISVFAVSDDNKFLVSAGYEDKIAKIWDIENRKFDSIFHESDMSINDMKITIDSQYLVMCSYDIVKVFDFKKRSLLYEIKNYVEASILNSDNKFIFQSADYIYIWDLVSKDYVHKFKVKPARRIAVTKDNKFIILCDKQRITLCDFFGVRNLNMINPYPDDLFSHDMKYIVNVHVEKTGSEDDDESSSIRFFDASILLNKALLDHVTNSLDEQELLGTYAVCGEGDCLSVITSSNCNKVIYAGSKRGAICEEHENLFIFTKEKHRNPITSIALTHSKDFLVTGSTSIKIWKKEKLVESISKAHKDGVFDNDYYVTALAITHDDKYLISGSGYTKPCKNSIKIWDLYTF
mmetsp:Transcript_23559/g.20463  ORF Transcript_23559/g.20463 Transcript_23559/m.20463 type:complete len:414 (-) Transcript_23559:363-1604(-)